MENKISNLGYCISKEKLSHNEIYKIKKDLYVTPFSNYGNFSVKSFKVYKETKDHFIIPIFYAINELKLTPDTILFPNIKSINLIDNIILRENQKECFNNCIKEFSKPYGGGIITLGTGLGKCLAKGTKVLMFDGLLKNVEDLKKGDLLMGDDNTSRKILTLVKGEDRMYDLVPVKGPIHTVNKAHILVLKNSMRLPEIKYRSSSCSYKVIWWEFNKLQNKIFKSEEEALRFKNEIKSKHQLYSEISVSDWLKTSKAFRSVFRSYRVPIDFTDKYLDIDPYLFNNLNNSKIPHSYKCNTKEKRLELIAGYIDRIAMFDNKSNFLYLYMKNIELVEDFIFVCRSLGLYSFYYKESGELKITIQGDLLIIPLRNKELLKNFNNNSYKDWSMTIMKVKYKEKGEYYGFTIDGNRRFLLHDFTVTHNTVISLKLIAQSKKKTLVVINKIELLNQWKSEIKKWIPDAKIGVIQGSNFEYENCDIVIGMLQTISIKTKLKANDFNWVNTLIIDETHNIAAEVFSNIMFKVRPQYIFGLTATLERKDKLEKIIKWYMGDILYKDASSNLKQSTEVHVLKYTGSSSVEENLKDGTAAIASMLTNISKDKKRNDNIVEILNKLIEQDEERCILVISDRIAQLKYINKVIGNELSGLFIGSMKSIELDNSKSKRIILGSYALVNEGFNLPKLNCLLFATPRSSITQAIGRIYRKEHNIKPIIIDIYDYFSIFKAQYYKRKKIYNLSIKDCMILYKDINETIKKDKDVKDVKCLFDDNDDENKNCLIDDF